MPAPIQFLNDGRIRAFAEAEGVSPEALWEQADERQRADLMRAITPQARDRGQFDAARAAAAERQQNRGATPPRPERAPMSVRQPRPVEDMPGARLAEARDEMGRRIDAWRDTQPAPAEPQPPRAGRAAQIEAARVRAASQPARPVAADAEPMTDPTGYDLYAAENGRPERQGPPDRFAAEAQGRASVIPRAVERVREGARDLAGRYLAGLDAAGRAAERTAGAGLSVMGMPEAGAALARGAAEPREWARIEDAPPAAAEAGAPPSRGAAPEAPAAPRQAAAPRPDTRPAAAPTPDRIEPYSAPTGAMSRPVAEAAAMIAPTAPATAEAIAAPAQALSVMGEQGKAPTRTQYQRAADAVHERLLTTAGPKHFVRLMEQGRITEAYQWRAFYESKDVRDATGNMARFSFAMLARDETQMFREVGVALDKTGLGETYELVEEESGFAKNEDGETFARFAIRNKETGDLFVRDFRDMEGVMDFMATVASPDALFERQQAEMNARLQQIAESAAAREEKVVEAALEFRKAHEANRGMPGFEERDAASFVQEARAFIDAASGLGTLGYSQGGGRNPAVPSVGAPNM